MFNMKFALCRVSKNFAVSALKELIILFSWEHTVIILSGVKIKPSGKVSKLPSSSITGTFVMTKRFPSSKSIRDNSSASNELFKKLSSKPSTKETCWISSRVGLIRLNHEPETASFKFNFCSGNYVFIVGLVKPTYKTSKRSMSPWTCFRVSSITSFT